MTATALELVTKLFLDLQDRDKAAVLAAFAQDAVLFDPHYPHIEMKGIEAITKGLTWGLSSMEQFGFDIVRGFSADDGAHAAVEVATHHVLKGGRKLDFPQAFFVDAADGKITRLQAYEPYRPNGAMGLFLGISHFKARRFG